MFAIHRSGRKFVDLDLLEFADGTRARTMSQPELFQRLVDLDVPDIHPSCGRDSLCEAYAEWLGQS
jgi:hypothetical protein